MNRRVDSMVKHYRCWHCKDNKWYTFEELIESKEDKGHTDYQCPKCRRVIICDSSRRGG